MSDPRRRHDSMRSGPDCPADADHGPMLRLPTGRWCCWHEDHFKADLAHPQAPVEVVTYTDAEVGL